MDSQALLKKAKKDHLDWRISLLVAILIMIPSATGVCLGFYQLLSIQSNTVDLSPRTTFDQRIFAERFIKPTISKLAADYEISPIKTRYQTLRSRIYPKFGEPVIVYVENYSPHGERLCAASTITNGSAIISIFLPSQMDSCLMLYNIEPDNWRKLFEKSLVVSIMHEMEHLADDTRFVGSKILPPAFVRELRAWANTCEFTLIPLKEASSDELYFYGNYYHVWMLSDRNISNPKWRSFIWYMYSNVPQ